MDQYLNLIIRKKGPPKRGQGKIIFRQRASIKLWISINHCNKTISFKRSGSYSISKNNKLPGNLADEINVPSSVSIALFSKPVTGKSFQSF